jgi:ferredoxin
VREPAAPLVVIQRGCELALFQPRKVGNVDCTFCLDCVQACPYDNVGIMSRTPATELVPDVMRSGLGFLSRRKDLAALVIVFAFGALLNAFAMVSPVYALEQWLAQRLRLTTEAPVLATVFGVFLVLEPLLLIGIATWITRVWSRSREALVPLAIRYSYSLVPIGFGIWLAHYSLHFLTGLFTFIPVTQAAVAELGSAILGQPQWALVGLPVNLVQIFEVGFIVLGLLGSLVTSYLLAATDQNVRPARAFVPWAALALVIAAAALWVMSQPMEMRGIVLGSG